MPRLFLSGAPLPGCLPWAVRPDDVSSAIDEDPPADSVQDLQPDDARDDADD
jgi:hypothetical protein